MLVTQATPQDCAAAKAAKEKKTVESRVENARLRGKYAGVSYDIPSELPHQVLSPLTALDKWRADTNARAFKRVYCTRAGNWMTKTFGKVLGPVLAGNPFAALYLAPFTSKEEGKRMDVAGAENVCAVHNLQDSIDANDWQTAMGWNPANDLPGKLARAAVGFGIDYATDPLSWITLGMGGLAKKVPTELAESAGKAGTKALVKNVIGTTLDTGVQKITTSSVSKMMVKRGMDKDTVKAIMGKSLEGSDSSRESCCYRSFHAVSSRCEQACHTDTIR